MEPLSTDRPHLPGYGIDEGTAGLLPWAWAVDRLRTSAAFWVATTMPDGRPHVMPVWGVWDDTALWFSSGLGARKARNLDRDDRCTVTTDDPHRPVVLDGRARRTTEPERIAAFAAAVDHKYGTDYGAAFYDPAITGVFAMVPARAIGLDDDAFTSSPTRWRFARTEHGARDERR